MRALFLAFAAALFAATMAILRLPGSLLAKGSIKRFFAAAVVSATIAFAAPAGAAAITVNSNVDPGSGGCNASECTLHEAIDQANASPGADTIDFAIVGTPKIVITGAVGQLPTVGDDITINGETQDPLTGPGIPDVEISGEAVTGFLRTGLILNGSRSTVRGLVINRFPNSGIAIIGDGNGADIDGNNTIAGNYIGTDKTGTIDLGNGLKGIELRGDFADSTTDATANNTIGGSSPTDRNVISGNNSWGIIFHSANLRMAHNYIGVNATGTAAIPNGQGIVPFASPQSGITLDRNVISGNTGRGFYVSGDNLTVKGNYVGTNAAGTAAIRNGNTSDGLDPRNAIHGSDLQIGGTGAGDGNVIPDGFTVTGDATIEGNRFGTNAAGTAALGFTTGLTLGGAGSQFQVGGTSAAARNIFSGNPGAGVSLGGGNAVVQGNYVGVDADGDDALPNQDGIIASTFVFDSENNVTIGGTAAGAGNVISGNTRDGLVGSIANSLTIQGNIVGLGADGTEAIGNARYGMSVQRQENAELLVGGATASAGNVVSANGQTGIRQQGYAHFPLGQVKGNVVGTDAGGTLDRGNGGAGVSAGGPGGVIGGPGDEANTIRFNGEGVRVALDNLGSNPPDWFPTRTRITQNSITQNDGFGNGLGIRTELFPAPQRPQHTATPTVSGGDVNVSAQLAGATADETYRIEFFTNTECDPSGEGEGRTFADATDVTTDGDGNATISHAFDESVLPAGGVVTMTATDSQGTTSQFSDCHPPPAPGTEVSVDDQSVVEGNSGLTDMVFTVRLNQPNAGGVRVYYSTSGFTADEETPWPFPGPSPYPPGDFQGVGGTLLFAPGETEKTITIKVIGDTTVEIDEQLFMSLSSDAGVTVIDTFVLGTILDDDGGPECSDGIDNDGDGKIDFGSGTDNDQGCSSTDDDSENTDVRDLAVSISDDPDPVPAGGDLVYTVDYRNDGNADSTTVNAFGFLPSLTDVSVSGDGWDCTVDTGFGFFSCTRPLIAAGTSAPVSVQGKAPNTPGALLTFHAQIYSTVDTETDYDNNSDSEETTVGTVAQCADGVDNDGDTKIDFGTGAGNDPGCLSANDPTEGTDSFPECSDEIDNDGDGNTDFPADLGCFAPYDDTEGTDSNPACSDEIDNDGDGKQDFGTANGNDPGCTSAGDTTEETDSNPQCSDEIDNDADSATDFPADPGCLSATDETENTDANPQCSDERDNDGDGKIDFGTGSGNDPGCKSASDNSESTDSNPQCSDEIDNDGDGKIDFGAGAGNDPGCSSATDDSEASVTITYIPVFGLKLNLGDHADSTKRKLNTQMKDVAISIGGGNGSADDPTLNGAALRVVSSSFDNTYALPSAGWKLLGKPGQNKGYKYKSSTGPISNALMKPMRPGKPGKPDKPGQLKLKGRGSGLGHGLATDPKPVTVVASISGRNYCAQFGGKTKFKALSTFTASKAPAPPTCQP